jgi:tRNA-splicing ligase RtcB
LAQFGGEPSDLEYIESGGKLEFEDPGVISPRALTRGKGQLGTLGSGNHFIEFETVAEIYDVSAARAFGIRKDQVVIMIHTGSRGFGHQVATDYIERIRRKNPPTPDLRDRQLVFAPVQSSAGRDYRQALNAASNFAWANRQLIMEDLVRLLESFFKSSRRGLGIQLLYDQVHNIAKEETHQVAGKMRRLLVHRKGATRAFPPDHPSLSASFRPVGQPVILPGSMGTGSYLMRGTAGGMELAFGSAPHGAGRRMSRKQALRESEGRDIPKELQTNSIRIISHSLRGIREEMPDAYKSIDEVAEVTHRADLARKVARMVPLLVIKG